MDNRRYFRCSIEELEQEYELSRSDCEKLYELLAELQRRDTRRAKSLALKIEDLVARSDVDRSGSTRAAPAREKVFAAGQPKSNKTKSGEASESKAEYPGSESAQLNSQPNRRGQLEEPARSRGSEAHVDFGDVEPIFADEEDTKPGTDSILASWLTLEVLTPPPPPKVRDLEAMGRTLVRLADCPQPWNEQRYFAHGRELGVHWLVYVGELDLQLATDAILAMYPDDTADEHAYVSGNTALAVIVLDQKGCPVDDKMFLSSFAWGYGQVRAGKLKGLASFPSAELTIKEKLKNHIVRQDEDGKILPIRSGDIAAAINWLSKALNLPTHEVIRPGIAIRVPKLGRYNEAPEPELLNSFYIADLVRARNAFRDKQVGKGLAAYMGEGVRLDRHDVVRNKRDVLESLAPLRFPLARWPIPGRHPLVLMQQSAINHIVVELKESGIAAVNGPPGTGKTTLLRDIVAKVVLDRAAAMARFEKPAEAFAHFGSMPTGGAYTHLYQLHESLIGHEIVVASTNNKAVENISREIPSAKAIAQDLEPSAIYFQSISDSVNAGNDKIEDGATWGLAAAVLGNASNRSAFAQSFYWHKKRGFARYLKFVLGDRATQQIQDDEGYGEESLVDVETLEHPPVGEIEALDRWRKARKQFLAQFKDVEELRQDAQSVQDAVVQRPAAISNLTKAGSGLDEAMQAHEKAVSRVDHLTQLVMKTTEAERKVLEDRAVIDRLRPGFFARLFGLQSYRQWRTQMIHSQEVVLAARSQNKRATAALHEAGQVAFVAEKLSGDCKDVWDKANATLKQINTTIESLRQHLGANLADENFWNQPDAELQLRSPWVFEKWQVSRDQLFVAAFQLQRAFIDASAKPMKHNISAAMELMKKRPLSVKNEAVRRSIWASFFLVVPVISTTFASVARLFGPLGKEELGWLLIDEAGQATPQAAVGAMYRAKRTVVIGDPLQIPPVVTVPPKLIRSIFSNFGVSSESWSAPDMSVQTLADRISWFGTNIKRTEGDIWVGCPLRVHRRCDNPMFKISNYVAYDGMMVHGTGFAPSEIARVLGTSRWIDVDGGGNGKWSEAEGRHAIELLRKLLDEGIKDPDIFFITPFRIVAQKLRELIRADKSITSRLPARAWEWTSERVGTVHTFQGKEAEVVVFILGAPLDESARAREWAGNPVNILNVAVTRAKRCIYVIGKRDAWKNVGAFSHLAQNLK